MLHTSFCYLLCHFAKCNSLNVLGTSIPNHTRTLLTHIINTTHETFKIELLASRFLVFSSTTSSHFAHYTSANPLYRSFPSFCFFTNFSPSFHYSTRYFLCVFSPFPITPGLPEYTTLDSFTSGTSTEFSRTNAKGCCYCSSTPFHFITDKCQKIYTAASKPSVH